MKFAGSLYIFHYIFFYQFCSLKHVNISDTQSTYAAHTLYIIHIDLPHIHKSELFLHPLLLLPIFIFIYYIFLSVHSSLMFMFTLSSLLSLFRCIDV